MDPEAIDPTGETTIDWFVPSPDGTRLAVSLSEHGTEDGTLHVFDVASGEVVDEPIPHVHLMGGSMAWRRDAGGSGSPGAPTRPGFQQQVWFRDLGGGADRLDVPSGIADERIAEHVLSASADGRWVMDRVQKGDGGEWQIFLRRQDPDAPPAVTGGCWPTSPTTARTPCSATTRCTCCRDATPHTGRCCG